MQQQYQGKSSESEFLVCKIVKCFKRIMEQGLEDMYRVTFTGGVPRNMQRSMLKTNVLHKFAGDFLSLFYVPEYSKLQMEDSGKRIKSPYENAKGKHQNVDGLGQLGDFAHQVYLAKAPVTSLRKNEGNFINALVGDAALKLTPEFEKNNNILLMFNAIPEISFSKKGENSLTIEKNKHEDCRWFKGKHPEEWLMKTNLRHSVKSIHEINIPYLIDFQGKSLGDLKTSEDLRIAILSSKGFIKIEEKFVYSSVYRLYEYFYEYYSSIGKIKEFHKHIYNKVCLFEILIAKKNRSVISSKKSNRKIKNEDQMEMVF